MVFFVMWIISNITLPKSIDYATQLSSNGNRSFFLCYFSSTRSDTHAKRSQIAIFSKVPQNIICPLDQIAPNKRITMLGNSQLFIDFSRLIAFRLCRQ